MSSARSTSCFDVRPGQPWTTDRHSAGKALAPQRAPIRIQRWSVRRIGLTLAVLAATVASLFVTIGALQGAKLL